jgi:hypothetical protein
MLAILRILHTIHEVSEDIEEGKEFHLDRDFGGVNLVVSAVLSPTVDESSTVVINHTDGRKISKTVINALLSALMGTEIVEGIAISLGLNADEDKPVEEFLVVTIAATIK